MRPSLPTVGYRPPTVTSTAPLHFLILLVASWIGRRQREAIDYLRAENRVLRARLGAKPLRFADAERRLLAEKGKPLGRKLLAEVASLASPETILRWYREQVAEAEGFVRSIEQECLRHIVPLGERHLRAVVREFVEHYHAERDRQGLGDIIPFPSRDSASSVGRIVRRERLGGIVSFYERNAA